MADILKRHEERLTNLEACQLDSKAKIDALNAQVHYNNSVLHGASVHGIYSHGRINFQFKLIINWILNSCYYWYKEITIGFKHDSLIRDHHNHSYAQYSE